MKLIASQCRLVLTILATCATLGWTSMAVGQVELIEPNTTQPFDIDTDFPYSPSGGNVRFGRGPARPGQPRDENPAETLLRDIEGTNYGHHTGRALFAAPVGGRPENIWRYHYYRGRWWYWTPQRRWAFFDGRRWMPYVRR